MTNATLQKQMMQTGAILAGTSVALGAFAAHSLKTQIPEYEMSIFETGIKYQFYHSLGILILAMSLRKLHEKVARTSFWLFILGIVLFSGSLYIIATRKLWIGDMGRMMGIITPLGGVSFIAGWLYLAVKGYKPTPSHSRSSARFERKDTAVDKES